MSLFSELKRRNVLRVGIAYLAAVWVLIQVADTLLPIVNSPPWILQALVVSSAVGFPVALILAWLFEWTSKGIKATSSLPAVERDRLTGRRIDFAIIGLLVVAIGFLLVGRQAAIEPSIAVLPFSNESAQDEDAEFFAYGMHNELLTRLGKIRSLTVSGRNSVMDYVDSVKSIREIGRELDVFALLTGQVQVAGETARINVQLIDAGRDEQLWAETYTTELTAANIFSIQGELATAIANELNATLTPEELEGLNAAPTQDTRAMLRYENGIYFASREDEPTYLPLAIEEFQAAVDIDQNFAHAWAELSRARSRRFTLGHDTSRENIDSALQAVERAAEIAPDLPEVHLAWSLHYATVGENEKSLEEIEAAQRGLPNDAGIPGYLALRYRRMGRWDEAIEAAERARELDPRTYAAGGGWLRAWTREYALARAGIERYRQVWPDDAEAYTGDVQASLWWYGEFEPTKAAAASPEVPLGPVRERMGWIAALYEGNYDDALAYANRMEDLYSGDRRYIPKESYIGVTHQIFERPELGRPYFQEAEAEIRAAIAGDEAARYYVSLAEAVLGLGQTEEAVQHAVRSLELMPRTVDDVAASRIQRDAIVRVLAPAGEVDAVIEQLGDYLDNPGQWSLEGLLPDPRFNRVREHPAFQAFVDDRSRQ